MVIEWNSVRLLARCQAVGVCLQCTFEAAARQEAPHRGIDVGREDSRHHGQLAPRAMGTHRCPKAKMAPKVEVGRACTCAKPWSLGELDSRDRSSHHRKRPRHLEIVGCPRYPVVAQPNMSHLTCRIDQALAYTDANIALRALSPGAS